MRQDWDAFFDPPFADARVQEEAIGGVPVVRISAPGASGDRTFVYIHGGGFRIGSPRSHADLIARIAAVSGATGLAIDYRLSPEHRFPAAIDDMVAVLSELEPDLGDVSVVADSAGAALALAAVQVLRDRGAGLPAGLVLLSPWVDLRMLGDSYDACAATDPVHRRKMLINLAAAYLGETDPATPLASPIEGDFTGLPPMLIHVGDGEVLLSDAQALAQRALAAGVPVEYVAWPGMIHVFQQFATDLTEAREAIDAIAAFISAPDAFAERNLMTAGIVAYGAYVPLLRLERAAIHASNAWYAPGLKKSGARSLAAWDEDVITMAVAAARDCLAVTHAPPGAFGGLPRVDDDAVRRSAQRRRRRRGAEPRRDDRRDRRHRHEARRADRDRPRGRALFARRWPSPRRRRRPAQGTPRIRRRAGDR